MRNITADFAKLGNVMCLDTETALAPKSFEGRNQVRLFQAYSPTHEFYYDLLTFDDADWGELKANLESPGLTMVFQNAAFDIRVLQGCGIDVSGSVIEDTMLQSWLLNNGIPTAKNNLAAIAKRILGVELDKTLQSQNWMTAELTAADLEYGMNDVRITWRCWVEMTKQVVEQKLDTAYEVEIKALLPTIQMESTGLYLDRDLIDSQMKDLEEERVTSLAAFVEELHGELQDAGTDGLPTHPDGRLNLNKKTSGSIRLGTKQYAGFNPGSAKQVLAAFKTIGIEPVDPTGKPSVDKKFLAAFTARSVVKTYLGWKRSDKHLQMAHGLVDAQHEDGRIYARFNQTGTFTGRYSSSGPNLQNIPRGDMRHCFAAPAGREMVDLDFSGMELRALCSPRIADEKKMADAFNRGDDIHRHTASLMFNVPQNEITDEERRQAKAVNFGAAYGSGPGGLVAYFQSLGQLISWEEGDAFLRAWISSYPAIERWHNNAREVVKGEGDVRMVDGRRRFLIGDSARHTIYCNNQVQGSCASATKLALYGVWKELPALDLSARIVGAIHDEILIECEQGKGEAILAMAREQMREAGEDIFGPEVPLEADGSVGASWGAAH